MAKKLSYCFSFVVLIVGIIGSGVADAAVAPEKSGSTKKKPSSLSSSSSSTTVKQVVSPSPSIKPTPSPSDICCCSNSAGTTSCNIAKPKDCNCSTCEQSGVSDCEEVCCHGETGGYMVDIKKACENDGGTVTADASKCNQICCERAPGHSPFDIVPMTQGSCEEINGEVVGDPPCPTP